MNNLCSIHFVETLYTLMVKIFSSLQSVFLLVIRLYWGWQFATTGWGKLMHLDKITEFFASLNIPMPHLNAIMAGSTECFGGMLLLLGLASRPAALALSFTMLVAYITADREALLGFFSNPEGFYQAAPYTFLFAALLVLIFGPGKISLDALIGGYLKKQKVRENI